jgi:tripartite-type tricarboxylate transporter receptor subunit TctC
MMRFLALAFAIAVPFAAQAQAWPAKAIRLVVPFAPGGTSSIVARAVAAEMEKGLGQSIVIDNRPGGGGNVAMQEVARAQPDGYTLAGRTQATSAGTPPLLPHVKSGKLRVIAVGSAQRLSILPEVATVAERFAVDNTEAVGSTPQDYAGFIAGEQARWG